MNALGEKIFKIGCDLIATYVELSVEETRKEEVGKWIKAFEADIYSADNKKTVPVTAINRFQVTPLPEEVTRFLSISGYNLKLIGEGSNAQYYLLLK